MVAALAGSVTPMARDRVRRLAANSSWGMLAAFRLGLVAALAEGRDFAGRLFAMRHAVASTSVKIVQCLPEPIDRWLDNTRPCYHSAVERLTVCFW